MRSVAGNVFWAGELVYFELDDWTPPLFFCEQRTLLIKFVVNSVQISVIWFCVEVRLLCEGRLVSFGVSNKCVHIDGSVMVEQIRGWNRAGALWGSLKGDDPWYSISRTIDNGFLNNRIIRDGQYQRTVINSVVNWILFYNQPGVTIKLIVFSFSSTLLNTVKCIDLYRSSWTWNEGTYYFSFVIVCCDCGVE